MPENDRAPVGRGGALRGDEFILLLPETPKREAVATAERTRQALQRLSLPAGPAQAAAGGLRGSIGVAACPADAPEVEELVARADAALYRAKAEGGGRVVGWSPQQPAPGSGGGEVRDPCGRPVADRVHLAPPAVPWRNEQEAGTQVRAHPRRMSCRRREDGLYRALREQRRAAWGHRCRHLRPAAGPRPRRPCFGQAFRGASRLRQEADGFDRAPAELVSASPGRRLVATTKTGDPVTADLCAGKEDRAAVSAKRILIADDTAFMRRTLRQLLEQNDLRVVGEAEDGIEAVQKYAKLRPDLVTLDITMPKMDGLAALKAILQLDPAANVIICSAMGQKSIVVEALRAGAKDFLVKPFQPQRVLQAIARLGP